MSIGSRIDSVRSRYEDLFSRDESLGPLKDSPWVNRSRCVIALPSSRYSQRCVRLEASRGEFFALTLLAIFFSALWDTDDLTRAFNSVLDRVNQNRGKYRARNTSHDGVFMPQPELYPADVELEGEMERGRDSKGSCFS